MNESVDLTGAQPTRTVLDKRGMEKLTPAKALCSVCQQDIPADAPVWYADEDQAQVYDCCSARCAAASGRVAALTAENPQLADPQLLSAVLANCTTYICFGGQS